MSTTIISLICGATSCIAYCIGVALSWAFSRGLFPESKEALAAAVIITLPFFVTVTLCFIGAYVGGDNQAIGCCGVSAMFFAVVTGILSLIGCALLIAAMVKAHANLDNPGGAITCGTFAAFFVLVTAITNFCTLLCIGIDKDKDKDKVVYSDG